MNLLQETKEMLAEYFHSASDVEFVYDGENYYSWTDFVVAAANVEYDNNNYCPTEINTQLVIGGKNWHLRRKISLAHEYWSYWGIAYEKPPKQEKQKIRIWQ